MTGRELKISLMKDLACLLGEDVDPLVFGDPALVLATIRQEFRPTIREIDLKIAYLAYMRAHHDVQTKIVESLVSLRSLIEEENRNTANTCKKCTSLLSVLPLDLVTELVRVAGGLEGLCLKNPSNLKGLKLFRRHPIVEKTENKEKAIRYIACKAALAARVDFYGNAPVDFTEEITMHFRNLTEAKARKKDAPGYVRSHRGGLRHRKKALRLKHA